MFMYNLTLEDKMYINILMYREFIHWKTLCIFQNYLLMKSLLYQLLMFHRTPVPQNTSQEAPGKDK